jgi:hypothetical protein
MAQWERFFCNIPVNHAGQERSMIKTLTQTEPVSFSDFRQKALLVLPLLLLVSTNLAFQWFVGLWGDRLGYLAGFGFYWLFWCLLAPLWLLGRDGLRQVSGGVARPGSACCC